MAAESGSKHTGFIWIYKTWCVPVLKYLYCYLCWVSTSILQYRKDSLPYQLLCWMQGYAAVCYLGSKSEPWVRRKILESFYPVGMLALSAFDAELCAMEQVRSTNHNDPFWQESKQHLWGIVLALQWTALASPSLVGWFVLATVSQELLCALSSIWKYRLVKQHCKAETSPDSTKAR